MSKDIRRRRYTNHRASAKKRAISFLLTFEEWWEVWDASGKWPRCGCRRGQYCMARFHDRGPYAWWNVRICLTDENNREREPSRGAVHATGTGRNYFAAASAAKQEAWRARLSMSLLGKNRKPKSGHMRAALSKTVTGRKAVNRDGRRTWAYPGDVDYPDVR